MSSCLLLNSLVPIMSRRTLRSKELSVMMVVLWLPPMIGSHQCGWHCYEGRGCGRYLPSSSSLVFPSFFCNNATAVFDLASLHTTRNIYHLFTSGKHLKQFVCNVDNEALQKYQPPYGRILIISILGNNATVADSLSEAVASCKSLWYFRVASRLLLLSVVAVE